MNQVVYTLKEVCQMLKISKSKYYRLEKAGKLKSFRYPESNRVMITHEELQRFLKSVDSVNELKM